MARKLLIQTFAASASIASVLAAAFTTIPRTEANTTGCVWNGFSCIYVNGDSLRVNYIKGGAQLAPRAVITGHMQITGYGFDVNTVERNYVNSDPTDPLVVWSEPVYLNRNLPNGSLVCSRFWRKVGNQHVSGKTDYACKTIKK